MRCVVLSKTVHSEMREKESKEKERGEESMFGEIFYKLKTPAWRLRDWIGKTITRERPRPTVRPTETLMSCNAVWKPDRYDVVDPDSLFLCANVSRPPLPSPLGS